MAENKCAGGCGEKVSRPGGRCRKCAGLLRRKKNGSRPNRPAPASVGGVMGIAEVLRKAGFNVLGTSIVEATVQVRLGAPKE